MPNPTPPSELPENPKTKFKNYKNNKNQTNKHGLGDKKGFHDLLPNTLWCANGEEGATTLPPGVR